MIAVALLLVAIVIGQAVIEFWRRLRTHAPDVNGPPKMMPRPGDPRWHLMPGCGSDDCNFVWLQAGHVEAGNGPDRFILLVDGEMWSDADGAEEYVESVHRAWRRRGVGLN